MKILSTLLLLSTLALLGCSGGSGGGEGDDGVQASGESSQPLNAEEEIQYRKALTRCYKTGGTRIVKIDNYLHCY